LERLSFSVFTGRNTPLVIYSYEAFGKEANNNYIAVRLKAGQYQQAIGKRNIMERGGARSAFQI